MTTVCNPVQQEKHVLPCTPVIERNGGNPSKSDLTEDLSLLFHSGCYRKTLNTDESHGEPSLVHTQGY